MEYKILEEIGLTSSESKVYLALLDLGSSTTWNVIKKSGVASSKIYELLGKLIKKGLVSEHIESNTKYFKAVNPERLKDYLMEKKQELEKKESEIEKILPELKLKFSEKEQETEVEVFKGYKGIETAFKEILKTLKKDDEFLVFGGSEGNTSNDLTRIFFERFHRQRSKAGIKLRIIFSENARKRYEKQAKFPNTEAKYISFGTPSTTNIYKNTTILLVMFPEPAAIRIKDKKTTESFRKYFEQMWKIAKK
jgi:HTH-type transcriptional regulator, sugar sensing transcriptional regulator